LLSSDCVSAHFLNQVDFINKKIAVALSHANSDKPLFCEVDWLSCHLHWTGALLKSGKLSDTLAAAVTQQFDAAMALNISRPKAVFHLFASIETIRTRIALRGRTYESNMGPLLHQLQATEWLETLRKFVPEVYEVEASSPIDAVVVSVRSLLDVVLAKSTRE